MPKHDPTTSRLRLTKDSAEIIDEDTTSVELVSQLDVSVYDHEDSYSEWHYSASFEPMFRAILVQAIEDYSDVELHRMIAEDTDTTSALGFSPGSVPDRSTFTRARNTRFEKLESRIETTARQIRELAASCNSPIGASLKSDNREGNSERTRNRIINQQTKQVTQEMQRLVFPAFSFDRAQNAHYETDTFCELQCHLGLSSSAAESGTDLFAEDTTRGSAPDADTHLRNIKQLDPNEILSMVDESIGRIVQEAKGHYQFDRPADVAIDMTCIPYFGHRDGAEMVMGAPKTKSYKLCYKFATLTVVGENVKFTLAVRPVQKGDLIGEVVRDLMQKAQEHVCIDNVYADSEFCSVAAFRALKEQNLNFIIPSPKNKRVKREIERMQREIEVLEEYGIYGPTSDGGTQEREESNLVLVPSSSNEEKTVAFATNMEVGDGTVYERQATLGVIKRYRRRWGIENSYKTIKNFLAWTTSKDYSVRLFYFGFAALLYNMWLLVDFIVQVSLDVEHRYKPRVTAKRFLNLARKQLGEPG